MPCTDPIEAGDRLPATDRINGRTDVEPPVVPLTPFRSRFDAVSGGWLEPGSVVKIGTKRALPSVVAVVLTAKPGSTDAVVRFAMTSMRPGVPIGGEAASI